MKFRLFSREPHLTVSVVLGDITRRRVDVIVNAADDSMLGGTGVDGAIRIAGGPRMSEACWEVGRLNGKAVITPGFDLPALWVIHVAAPVWVSGMQADLLAETYTQCIAVAQGIDAEVLAFPLLGAGAFGWDAMDSALAAQTAIRKARKKGHLQHVQMVAFSQHDASVLEEVFNVPSEITDEPRVYHIGAL